MVSGRKRFALMNAQEGARTFPLRVLDRREPLFDELAAGDLLAGKKLRKLDDRHRGEFTSWPALCEDGFDAPKRCAGKRKSAEPGRFLQKVPTIEIHGVFPSQ